MDRNITYGADGGIKISFGRGTIHQAFEDRTVGGVNFGYDEDNDFGVTYIEGKLYSPKVLDIAISGQDGEEKTVLVKYVNDDGYVAEKTYKTLDASLVDAMIQAALPAPEQQDTYSAGDYIGIEDDPEDEKNHIVSVRYDDIYARIRENITDDLDVSAIRDAVGEIGENYVIGIEQSEEQHRPETDTFVARTVVDGEYADVSINVPTDDFYNRVNEHELTTDASIADLEERKANKDDIHEEWKDVHDLLEEARNE